jgi:hypothetical protein
MRFGLRIYQSENTLKVDLNMQLTILILLLWKDVWRYIYAIRELHAYSTLLRAVATFVGEPHL